MRFPICLILAIVVGCSEKETFDPVYQVPEEFEAYINNFVLEAEKRGTEMKIENLIIRYDPNLEAPLCALSNTNVVNANFQKVIYIRQDPCYKNEYELEAMLFHELGHCILGREHNNELLPSGDPKSLMVQNNIYVYAPCEYQIGEETCNKIPRRSYYIDELFNENTPVPDWGQ